MSEFFLTLLNMSLVSCWLILALLILRPLLKKAPKAFVCALWGLVGLRLICPFSIESFLSLIPDSEPISKEIIVSQTNITGTYVFDEFQASDTVVSYTLAPPAGASLNPLQAISLVAAFIWAVGVATMLIISLVSYLRLRKSVSASVNTGGNVFINDDIASPFVLGLFKPRIYIPSSLTEYEKEYVIAHENAHIKRRDYLIKPLGYAILSLHWFNPLVWVAYILLCRDIESACDERVIKKMDGKGKKEYSEVLLRLSMPATKIRACPVAFGEVGVKARIKSVLNYKKPAFWIVTLAVVLAGALTLGFLTNPVKNTAEDTNITVTEHDNPAFDETTIDGSISKAIADNSKSENAGSRFTTVSYTELNTISFRTSTTCYVWAYYGEYEEVDGSVKLMYESFEPAIIKLSKSGERYNFVEYNVPEDRKNVGELTELFPKELHSSVIFTPGYYNDHKAACMKTACEYFGSQQKSYEMLPAFNAIVTDVYENAIIVEPFTGEKVSGNTFESVSLSTKKLTSDSYIPKKWDSVRVRYLDVISIDTTIPRLYYVYTIEKLEPDLSELRAPVMIYAANDNYVYYVKESSEDMIYVYTYNGVDIWYPGTYIALDEEQMTFRIIYKTTSDSELENIISTGSYKMYGDELVLDANDHDTGILCFVKSGDTFTFSSKLSARYSGEVREYPFEDGTEFKLNTNT